MRILRSLFLGCGLLAVVASGSSAQMTMKMKDQPADNDQCKVIALDCADTVTPYFAKDGRLWIAGRAGNKVFVTQSSDHGRTFSQPVVVSQDGVTLDWGPDARPKIVVNDKGEATVAYAIFRNKNFDGEVFFTHSTDGGKTFAVPQPIASVQESQRFEALALESDGSIFAAWLDKRDRVAAKKNGVPFIGAGLAFAWSHDQGATFTESTMAFDSTCECCRLAVAFAAPGRPVVAFRNAFDGKVRDHAVTTFENPSTPGPIRRVSVDDWATDVCPHHGPTLAIGPDGTYHVAWFTQGRVRKGLFYAYSRDQGRSFSEPMKISITNHAPARPFLLALGGAIYMTWKEYDGETTSVPLRISHDGGATWTDPAVIAKTADDSDHPMLVSDGTSAYLSWRTKLEGYRLISLGNGS